MLLLSHIYYKLSIGGGVKRGMKELLLFSLIGANERCFSENMTFHRLQNLFFGCTGRQ